MTHAINLLPWREIRRQKEKQQFIDLALAGLMAVIILCLLMNYCASSLMGRQQNYNQRLNAEIRVLNKKINEIKRIKKQKNRLIKQIIKVEKLQNSRILAIHLFAELVRIIPKGIYLHRLHGTRNRITIEGFSESNFSLSELMKNIELNPWMQNPNLIEIKKDRPLTTKNRFGVNFCLKSQIKGKGDR
jgi:type IV pilus assembly protein PilN